MYDPGQTRGPPLLGGNHNPAYIYRSRAKPFERTPMAVIHGATAQIIPGDGNRLSRVGLVGLFWLIFELGAKPLLHDNVMGQV